MAATAHKHTDDCSTCTSLWCYLCRTDCTIVQGTGSSLACRSHELESAVQFVVQTVSLVYRARTVATIVNHACVRYEDAALLAWLRARNQGAVDADEDFGRAAVRLISPKRQSMDAQAARRTSRGRNDPLSWAVICRGLLNSRFKLVLTTDCSVVLGCWRWQRVPLI